MSDDVGCTLIIIVVLVGVALVSGLMSCEVGYTSGVRDAYRHTQYPDNTDYDDAKHIIESIKLESVSDQR